jgi:hypothetical protein
LAVPKDTQHFIKSTMDKFRETGSVHDKPHPKRRLAPGAMPDDVARHASSLVKGGYMMWQEYPAPRGYILTRVHQYYTSIHEACELNEELAGTKRPNCNIMLHVACCWCLLCFRCQLAKRAISVAAAISKTETKHACL